MRTLLSVLIDFRRGGGTWKVSWNQIFNTFLKKTICLYRKQLVLVAWSTIYAVQSLQLEHDAHQISIWNYNCFPNLAVGNITKIAIF